MRRRSGRWKNRVFSRRPFPLSSRLQDPEHYTPRRLMGSERDLCSKSVTKRHNVPGRPQISAQKKTTVRRRLLARGAYVRGSSGLAAAPRIDVEPAAARVARVDAESARCAASHQIHVDALDAMFVEIRVLAERNEIAQQPFAIDAASA